jgi:orotate phosphoribosyltransferase
MSGYRWCYTFGSVVSTNQEKILELFQQTGALLQGHYLLTSGLHSPEYMQCALVLQYPHYAETFGQKLAGGFRKLEPLKNIDLVVSPAIGGLIIGQEVARALNTRHIFAERENGHMTLRRGFNVKKGETAVVVEDVITTGGSSVEVVDMLKEADVRVVGAGSIIDRSGGRANVGVPRIALAVMHIQVYDAKTCPLCAKGSVAVKPGSRT